MNRTTTSWIFGAVAGLVLGAVACGDDGGGATDAASNIDAPNLQPDAQVNDGPIPDASSACLAPVLPGAGNHQYVADSIIIPTVDGQHTTYALDIDGNGSSDNQLGQVVVFFSGEADLGIQESVDSQIASGALLYIANVVAADLVDVGNAELGMFLGQDCDGNPADNFAGDELFQVRASSPTDSAVAGPIASGALNLGPGNLTVVVPFPGIGNISLPLFGARMVGDIDANGITNGIIGGGIKEEDVQGILIPALHQTMSMTVSAACTGTMPPNCMCSDPAAEDLLGYFDTEDHDCAISLSEVQNNIILNAFLSSDLDLFDSNNGNVYAPNQDGLKDSLSLGVGFTMVGAQFQLPPP